jgi:hypothetical protein
MKKDWTPISLLSARRGEKPKAFESEPNQYYKKGGTRLKPNCMSLAKVSFRNFENLLLTSPLKHEKNNMLPSKFGSPAVLRK